MAWNRRNFLKALSSGSLTVAVKAPGTPSGLSEAHLNPRPLVKPTLRVALMQVETTPDVEGNYRRALEMARAAAREKPDVLAFPELFAVGLPPEGVGMYAQPIPGPVTDAFAKLAHDTGTHIVFGMPEKGERAIYNTLVLAGPAGIVGRYHKTHLFYDAHRPHRNEQQLFAPGRHLGNFDSAVGALGLFTCHDGLYPEVPRCLTLQGADLLVWCLNDGPPLQWAPHHVYYNLIPLAAVNRVEKKDGAMAGGGSALLAADGKVICQSQELKEEFLIGEVDLAQGRNLRQHGEGMQAFFRVRRPDLYGPIVRT